MSRYVVSGTITVGVWRMVGGVWQHFTNKDVSVQTVVSGGGYRTVSWSMNDSFSLGAGVTDFGVTIEASDGDTTLTGMTVSWTTQAASGERSATPAGEQAMAVVRP